MAKSKQRWLPYMTLFSGMVAAAALVMAKPAPQPRTDVADTPPAVNVMSVSPAEQVLTVTTQGTVQPRRQIELVAQVAGQVVASETAFVSGGYVQQAQGLLSLEKQDYQLAVVQAKAKVANAKQQLAEEKGRVLQAKKQWRELGSAEANALFLRQPQLASVEAALQAAEAELAQAELNLQRTTIVAPFNGRIVETYVDVGQYVTVGTPLAKVYATDVAEVRLPLTDRQLALLDLPLDFHQSAAAHSPVAVTINASFAGRDWQWPATIRRTEASVDVRSRLFYAIAEIEQPFQSTANSPRPPLQVGQYVRAEIVGSRLPDVVSLPRQALYKGSQVWVMDEQNLVKKMPVNVVQATVDSLYVTGDFTRNTRVVVTAMPGMSEGMAVVPQLLDQQYAGLDAGWPGDDG